MALEKQYTKTTTQLSSSSIGVSLKDISISRPQSEKNEKTSHEENSEIVAYAHDARMSVVIGAVAVLIQLGLFFGKVI